VVTVAEALAQGTRHQQAGQLAEAERLYRLALQADPQNAQALNLLGTIAMLVGQPDQAVALLNQAIRIDRSQPAYHVNLGEAHRLCGDLDAAVACTQAALRLQPNLQPARYNLSCLYHQQGNLSAAESWARQAVKAVPDDPKARAQLGRVQHDQGKFAEAEASFRRALRVAPDDAAAHGGLGLALVEQNRNQEGCAELERSVALDPSDAKVHNNLANVLREFRMYDRAELHYREALRLDSTLTATYGNFGGLLTNLGRHREAVELLSTAVERDPRFTLALHNYVVSLREVDRVDDAVAASLQALAINPNDPDVHSNLGVCYKAMGRVADAIACYRTAIRLNPQGAYHGGNLVYALNFLPEYDPPSIFAEHLEWGRRHADALTAASPPHPNDRAPGRRLRVGYVSGHFCDHAVNFFSEPILASHDHAHFEVYCYSNHARADETNQRLRGYADGWREIGYLSDVQAAELVRQDRIDILVDLAGHIAGNRLLVFAHKPAPVQVTYIGYQNTTGMQAMDYRLTDAWADPPGATDAFYTEQLVRLPRAFFCYRPSPLAPDVDALPAASTGAVTFGSFNNFAKVTPQLLATWARILQAVPQSKIVVLAPDTPSIAQRVVQSFAAAGVSPQRVTMAPRRGRADYMKLIQQVDLALDPFPFNGHTTTCDALWQGVPVVTLAGRMYANRFGSSAHVNLGLEDLIAQSPDEYVQIAARLAGDLARLARLRAELRGRMTASPLLDFVGFTRNLESAYRQMWATWCAGTPG
jgi:predicted O-linked N-acetylglucosamine transferase (SPINDLY family)